jgi:hypothetical protein
MKGNVSWRTMREVIGLQDKLAALLQRGAGAFEFPGLARKLCGLGADAREQASTLRGHYAELFPSGNRVPVMPAWESRRPPAPAEAFREAIKINESLGCLYSCLLHTSSAFRGGRSSAFLQAYIATLLRHYRMLRGQLYGATKSEELCHV